MQRALQTMRERPHEERQMVALGAALVVTLALFVAWGTFVFGKTPRTEPALVYSGEGAFTAKETEGLPEDTGALYATSSIDFETSTLDETRDLEYVRNLLESDTSEFLAPAPVEIPSVRVVP